MVPDSSRHHLDVNSRINYAKVYTVEHNVKVLFIGRISPKYEQQVTTDYNNTHRPLPDRPYLGDMTDEEFGHAEGPDPQYPTRQMSPPATTSWSSPGAAQMQVSRAVQPSMTVASSYGAPVTSSWSTLPTTQPSLYAAQAPYVSDSTSPENYAVPYPVTSTYKTLPTTTEPQSQTYPQHSGGGEAAGPVAEETAIETKYDPLYDVSD